MPSKARTTMFTLQAQMCADSGTIQQSSRLLAFGLKSTILRVCSSYFHFLVVFWTVVAFSLLLCFWLRGFWLRASCGGLLESWKA